MWYWLQNGLEAALTLGIIVAGITLAYLACKAVRSAYSDIHNKN